jgi:hypothetical protein
MTRDCVPTIDGTKTPTEHGQRNQTPLTGSKESDTTVEAGEDQDGHPGGLKAKASPAGENDVDRKRVD